MNDRRPTKIKLEQKIDQYLKDFKNNYRHSNMGIKQENDDKTTKTHFIY